MKKWTRSARLNVLGVISLFILTNCATASQVYVPFLDDWEAGELIDTKTEKSFSWKICEPDETGNRCVVLPLTEYEKKKRRLAELEEKCGGE